MKSEIIALPNQKEDKNEHIKPLLEENPISRCASLMVAQWLWSDREKECQRRAQEARSYVQKYDKKTRKAALKLATEIREEQKKRDSGS